MDLTRLHFFWFGEIAETADYYQVRVPRWFFGQDAGFDRACQSFTPLFSHINPLPGKTPREHLAKILLFDQIPRNSYRESPMAHAFDLTAWHLTLEALDTSLERELTFPEKMFLYMPLEHAEDADLQRLSVAKFDELHRHAPEGIRSWTQLALNKVHEHRETIIRFGRFPQRNKRLGRTSSPEELVFLNGREV